MRPFLAHIIAPWLVANLLIATIGLPLHTLTCYCKGEISVSLFKQDHDCKKEHDAPVKGCCKAGKAEEAALSCHAPKTESAGHQCQKTCADYEQQFVKLDTKFTTSFDKSVAAVPAVLGPAVLPELWQPATVATTTDHLSFGFHHPPPRPAGRDLLLRVNVLIC